MTAPEAIAFVARHGIVLQSAQHATVPSLAAAVAGERIRGSWWAHPKSREIYRALVAVHGSPDVVATRLVDGKITLIHRRLWAALAALTWSERLVRARMARVTEEHTEAGRHETHEVPFPDWLPTPLPLPSVEQAISALGAPLAASLLPPGGATPRSRGSAGRAARGRHR
jgi:hypothetical protein